MQARGFVALLVILLAQFSGSVYAQGGGMSEYTLGSGDVIRILVYGEDDLSVESQLSDAGTLSYPFLGELQLLGLTVGELQNKITQGLLGDYLIDPKVSVTILEYRQFYINGEVEKPGGFPFQPGLTIRKAVSLAEGFTERASKKNIFVVSDNDPTSTPRRVELNSPVQPGDSITIEQSFF
ncbi:polysaccharide export protein [Aestuariicella hydrocarbonica]|uniref:Polysaccharide export protein n=2 Tax=Pseudomaricurvus hydrocarbonicus TaxID=1470433 RepID=A0A9E5T2K8_9GAMM|nr:polysaccharide export protein [Aestuariicella hydrocarbonica]